MNPPAMQMFDGIGRRTKLLSFAIAASALLYIVFIDAAMDEDMTRGIWFIFPVSNLAILVPLTIYGLRLNDRLGLPMPILRSWEQGAAMPTGMGRDLLLTILWTVPLSAVIAWLAPMVEVPGLPGSILERLATTPFAAINLQIILLLVLGSLLFRFIGNRIVVAILCGALLALFHIGGSATEGDVLLFQTGANGILGAIFGWLYLRYGFEHAIVGHALSHMVLMLGV